MRGINIPSQAIVPSQRGSGVHVIKGGKAEPVPVETGMRTEDRVMVLSGLAEGDLVAIAITHSAFSVSAFSPKRQFQQPLKKANSQQSAGWHR